MFGTDDSLRSPETGLKFNLDYRQRVSNAIADRWLDRLIPDGTWTPNLFQFFHRVYPKLIEGLKLPFAYHDFSEQQTSVLFPDPIRRAMSPVHEAIQEALVNALIHADYHGDGGVVVERFSDRIELSNPGMLLISLEQWVRGAVSECRNPSLQLMFQLLGAGDKAGSGVDKIRQGWASQKWRWPRVEVHARPDRVHLIMPMTSLLPDESLEKLRHFDGFEQLNGNEVEALVTAELEGVVTNERLQQFSMEHTTDITKTLQRLVNKGFLVKNGYGRWANYRLTVPEERENSMRKAKNSERKGQELRAQGPGTPSARGKNSERKGQELRAQGPGTPSARGGNSERKGDILENDVLLQISAPARENARLAPSEIRRMIHELCKDQFLTLAQIGRLLNRGTVGLRMRFIQKMVKDNELVPLHSELNHPQQAYKTNPDWLG